MPQADRLFKAFADRTRLRILGLLGRGELCVCDIVAALGVPQPRVSRHLAYLRRLGLVRARKQGHWKHYELVAAQDPVHRVLLECLNGCLSRLDTLRRDAKALEGRRAESCR